MTLAKSKDIAWKCDECGRTIRSVTQPKDWLSIYILGRWPGRPSNGSLTGFACSRSCMMLVLDKLTWRLARWEDTECDSKKCAKCELGLVLVDHRIGCPKRKEN